MSRMIKNIRTVLWLMFVLVVVVELILAIMLSTGIVFQFLEQPEQLERLVALTTLMSWLAVIDKLLIVCLFGTFVFEEQD